MSRPITVPFALLLVPLALAAAEIGRIPPLLGLAEIRVSTPSNWCLRIYTNGSAHFFGAAAFSAGADCPSNTFTFSKVYELFSGHVQTNGTAREFFVVTFEGRGKQP